MVFLTFVNMVRNPGPPKFWRVQQQLRFSWRFFGRKRNCYRIGMRYVNKALMYSTIGRKVKKDQFKLLWNTRLDAAAQEHGLDHKQFLEGLARSHIQLDRKVLTDLAIYEPRTFKSLCEISKTKLHQEGLAGISMAKPEGVITRGML